MPYARGERGVRIDPDPAGFIRALRASPARLDLGIRKEFRDVAKDVRDAARSAATGERYHAVVPRPNRVPAQHWKNLVTSITSGSTGRSPHVSIGSSRVPWALSMEFGSYRYRAHRWRGAGRDAGYFFFPTVRERTRGVRDRMVEILNEAYRAAFPESRG